MPDVLEILDGIVDIYLPDFKYWDGKMAKKYSKTSTDYPEITRKALLEMHRQVGVARPNEKGIINRGLMIRHLVMPHRISGAREIINWIAANLHKDTYVNLMSQYTPTYKASKYPKISRRITRKEYAEVVKRAKGAGLTNYKTQRMPLF